MIAFATRTPPPAARDRTRNVVLWMVQVALAAQLALAGGGRLVGRYQELADRVNRTSAELCFRFADGSLDPAGAAGAAVPAVVAAAALGLVAVVVAASVAHLVGLLAWAHGPLARR